VFLVVAAGLVFVSRSCVVVMDASLASKSRIGLGSASRWHEEAFFGVSVISSELSHTNHD
jgi:hypothetical protein